MKTYLVDLDGIDPIAFKNLMGFVLTIGLNFRKLDQKTESGTGRTLFVEVLTKREETALKEFLEGEAIATPIIVGKENKASLNGKALGKFTLIEEASGNCYHDRTTGRKFAIVRS
jgi:hypothetical protein